MEPQDQALHHPQPPRPSDRDSGTVSDHHSTYAHSTPLSTRQGTPPAQDVDPALSPLPTGAKAAYSSNAGVSASTSNANNTNSNNSSSNGINAHLGPRSSSSPALVSPSSSSTSISPLPPRLPGTPPANPPPRFFTRPHRRTQDHHHSHHHHGSVHGPGSGQNSASIGVRSAFKDFVVPAQIILVCSILNALWPTLLRIITTTLEFLVLVLSSYSACARRSDDCYFLEPLFHDGQDAVYLGTIQWTLRGVFCIVFLSGLYFVGMRLEKIWSALMSNRQRPRSFWSPENLWSWLMAYPNLIWAFIAQLFPWKITRSYGSSSKSRSSQSTRHLRKSSSTSSQSHPTEPHQPTPKSRGNSLSGYVPGHVFARHAGTSSAVDTDAFSAGSGSESKARSKTKARKSKGAEELLSKDSHPQGASTISRSASCSIASVSESTEPITSRKDLETSSQPNPMASPTATTAMEDSSLCAAETAPSAVYETADDGDFISTDRRRRRKTKGLKGSVVGNSSEALIKATSSRDQEPVSLGPNTLSQSIVENSALSTVHVAKTSSSKTHTEGRSLDAAAQQKQRTVRELIHPQPSTSKPTLETAPIKPLPIKTSAIGKEFLLSPTSDSTFVHPLHALNSTSPIVRLKPSHKRSQSAQLPLPSPWSIPQPASLSKTNHGSSLSQMTLSISPTSTISPTSPVTSPGLASPRGSFKDTESLAQSTADQEDSCSSKDYALFGQSSIWYSPFQSGLDISIESDQEKGRHGSRALSKPRIQIDAGSTQQRASLGPMLPPSSFFESSPRTPRIMPFSQHYHHNSLGIEDWSMRTRSSSIAAPMTPLLETDCVDPMDYFGGSRSASSSRRGSVENNLTESLLSGRARMFATTDPTALHHRHSSPHPPLSQEGRKGPISEAAFLSPRFSSSISATSAAFTSSANSPVLGQSPLDSPQMASRRLPDVIEETSSTFVNPWESNYPYKSRHTMSETFLPFGASSSAVNTVEHGVDRERQSSLLRLMNGDSGVGSSEHVDTAFGSQDHNEELEAIRRGFLFPSLAHHSNTAVPSSEMLSSFRPFESVEISLAAAANQPPPLLDEPEYDFVELTMQDMVRKQTPKLNGASPSPRTEISEKRSRDRYRHGHGRTRSGHHKSASLSSFFPPMPPTTGVSDNATPGIQANTAGTWDPLNRLSHSVNGEGGSQNGQGQGHGHTKQGRHQGSGANKEVDGASSMSGRRRAGTDQENQHRGANKHHNDLSKSRRTPKKDP